MDHQNLDLESRRSSSFGRLTGASSSRRHSLSISFSLPRRFDDPIESDTVSEAGDIGDRALHSNRTSASGRSHFSLENGAVVPLEEDNLFQPSSSTSFQVGSSALENVSHMVDATIQFEEKKEEEEDVPWLLEYITCLLSLAVFGILGVLARYGLQKLFGPGVIGATSDHSYMYLDLPSNMIGSFLMGWLGVVFKADILKISEQLAIGLTTGFLGSLTTFSGWNQKMLDLSVNGQWVFAVLGVSLGLFLVAYSIIFGIETAKGLKWLHRRRSNPRSSPTVNGACFSNEYHRLLTFMTMLLVTLILLWALFGSLAKQEFKTGNSEAQLFLACMVGPFGVWFRWYLARFNGLGLGKNRRLKWMPFGTLAANVVAACVMAALATLKKVVDTRDCVTLASGIQFGLLGCLSTVSTFIAEFHAMRESNHPWRAYAYAAVTFMVSFVLGTLIYSISVWVRGYD